MIEADSEWGFLNGLIGQHVAIVRDSDFKVLLVANAMGALGTALISPVLNSLNEPFGVSTDEIGLLVTAVTAPAIMLIPVSGLLADRVGRKSVLIVGLLCFWPWWYWYRVHERF